MNILGHSYIATKAVSGKRQLLIIGSLLPESSPFITDNPFTWEEIHEKGVRFLEFLDKKYPEKRDLALGILAHSYKFGADKFNQEIEKYAGFQREKLLDDIADCLSVDLKKAAAHLHNFLWWGMDLWILREFPEFVREVQSVLRIVDIEGISGLQAEGFRKNHLAVERVVRTLFKEIYRPKDLSSVKGLAQIWTKQAAGLPGKDKVDTARAEEIIKTCAGILENEWQNILREVETSVGENLRPFTEKEGVTKKNKD